ncbi:hypothetical protein BLNAU_13997 [Blattamonas nauphoetae]|uniref:Uncharacterized protein n=1 Tax=Blattamonas nauphoetae TaxID=2049346 RepID=A0ABQ9XEZ0_9EUKA|nr:hypothetical protein BLNAU_13997 [Blattamonas nauphoetae]
MQQLAPHPTHKSLNNTLHAFENPYSVQKDHDVYLPSLQDASLYSRRMNQTLAAATVETPTKELSSTQGNTESKDMKSTVFLQEWDTSRKDRESEFKGLLRQIDGLLVQQNVSSSISRTGLGINIDQISFGTHQGSTERQKKSSSNQLVSLPPDHHQQSPSIRKKKERPSLYEPKTREGGPSKMRGRILEKEIRRMQIDQRRKDGTYVDLDEADDSATHDEYKDRKLGKDDPVVPSAKLGSKMDDADATDVMELICSKNEDEKREGTSAYTRLITLTQHYSKYPTDRSIDTVNEQQDDVWDENESYSSMRRSRPHPGHPQTKRGQTFRRSSSQPRSTDRSSRKASISGQVKARSQSSVPPLHLNSLSSNQQHPHTTTSPVPHSPSSPPFPQPTGRLPPLTSREVLHPNRPKPTLGDPTLQKHNPALPLAQTAREFSIRQIHRAREISERTKQEYLMESEMKWKRAEEESKRNESRPSGRTAFVTTNDMRIKALRWSMMVHTASYLATLIDVMQEHRSKQQIEAAIARRHSEIRRAGRKARLEKWQARMSKSADVLIRLCGQAALQHQFKARRTQGAFIRTVLIDVRSQLLFPIRSMQFRGLIVKAQQALHRFFQCHYAKLAALEMIWARVEYHLLQFRPFFADHTILGAATDGTSPTHSHISISPTISPKRHPSLLPSFAPQDSTVKKSLPQLIIATYELTRKSAHFRAEDIIHNFTAIMRRRKTGKAAPKTKRNKVQQSKNTQFISFLQSVRELKSSLSSADINSDQQDSSFVSEQVDPSLLLPMDIDDMIMKRNKANQPTGPLSSLQNTPDVSPQISRTARESFGGDPSMEGADMAELKKELTWRSLIPPLTRKHIILGRIREWREIFIRTILRLEAEAENSAEAAGTKKDQSFRKYLSDADRKALRPPIDTIPLFPFFQLVIMDVERMVLEGMEMVIKQDEEELSR